MALFVGVQILGLNWEETKREKGSFWCDSLYTRAPRKALGSLLRGGGREMYILKNENGTFCVYYSEPLPIMAREGTRVKTLNGIGNFEMGRFLHEIGTWVGARWIETLCVSVHRPFSAYRNGWFNEPEPDRRWRGVNQYEPTESRPKHICRG